MTNRPKQTLPFRQDRETRAKSSATGAEWTDNREESGVGTRVVSALERGRAACRSGKSVES